MMTSVHNEEAPKAVAATETTPPSSHAKHWTASSLGTSLPDGGHLESPPHSIRTRLWKLNIENSDGAEVFAVGRAIAQKRQDIQDCEKAIQFHQDRLESLHEELRDFRTWRGPT